MTSQWVGPGFAGPQPESSSENSLRAANLQGNRRLLGEMCAEKALDSRVLRQNSLRRRAGNFFAPSREYAGVRRETGEEYEVKVLYGEGRAHHRPPSRAQSIARSAAKRRQGEA